jgi:hypothetical protein
MNLTLAEYLKLKNLEPGSEEAVHMGCTCQQEIDKASEQAKITIDPYCPFHWHIAAQAFIKDFTDKSQQTEKFNEALKFGYLVLGVGMAAIMLFKF